jgi:hypothetical protein
MKAASSTGARRGPAKPPTRAYINITLFEYDILHHLNMFFLYPKQKQSASALPPSLSLIYEFIITPTTHTTSNITVKNTIPNISTKTMNPDTLTNPN